MLSIETDYSGYELRIWAALCAQYPELKTRQPGSIKYAIAPFEASPVQRFLYIRPKRCSVVMSDGPAQPLTPEVKK